MKIVDLRGDELKACCYFNYKDFEVSISTIFNDCSVGVFRDSQNISGYFNNVQKALEFINKQKDL